MVKLTEEMKKSINEAIVFLATSSKDGIPNVVPMKALKVVDDETVVICDNFMHKTLKNIKENPNVAIATSDCRDNPFQYKGVAEYYTEGEWFEVAKEIDKPFDKVPKGAVVIKIKEIYNIKSGEDAGKLIAKDE
ncbi:pyridoxamine 5'-phosphate oxidase family protein [Methanothermococcus okinawensis]|uniref:Pyridoxamine 5'-phosphate oxidase-related FMN-binding protein n=1 Tax=Methanothermococcus okinawensis (strain DSM 14208 / JCM 11175 / IH1) TaxID=647113 RepID=F8ALY5_METOI|nr:pyridoxamine 5'-phosphate oxidase family protein [Methanothermococcus okinawensis]AEH06660.1 pyridoxamine 5'-phosphate oxidase-related FMN-binding protein [Methanothermococcus okinawensis IH1]